MVEGPRIDEDIEIEEGLQDYDDAVEDELAEAWEDYDRYMEDMCMLDYRRENEEEVND